MNPYTTLQKGAHVGIVRKVASVNSNVKEADIGKTMLVTGLNWSGRRHNRYICWVYLQDPKGVKRQAVLSELALLNPNFEPESDFIVCVGCGATVSEQDLRPNKELRGIKACPSCGMLEPHES